MASQGMQMLGAVLCMLGWAGVIIACVFPMWKVTAFVGSSIMTSQTVWEGIWMNCIAQSTGQVQCKPYYSQLDLAGELQAARALMVLAVLSGAVGLILAFIGGKCTRFLDEDENGGKQRVALAAGAMLMITGLLCLIPTAWTAGSTVKRFYSTAIDAQKRELGACLYIGFLAAILLILGGGLFLKSSCPNKERDQEKNPSARYIALRSTNGSVHPGSNYNRVPTAPPTVRAMSPKAQSVVAAPAKSQVQNKPPPYETEPESNVKETSEGSWAPSIKSQMQRPESKRSQYSEASTTKSQLKLADMDETLSNMSENDDPSSNAVKTYL